MAALIVIGILLVFGSVLLFVSRDAVTCRVTSQPLGSLPPGYAATKQGYRAYVGLVADVGLIALAVGLNNVWLIIGSIAVFVIGTVTVMLGEVRTYRALKR